MMEIEFRQIILKERVSFPIQILSCILRYVYLKSSTQNHFVEKLQFFYAINLNLVLSKIINFVFTHMVGRGIWSNYEKHLRSFNLY